MVRYLTERDGVPLTDLWAYQPYTKGTVWNSPDGIDEDVAWLGPTAPERLGYPTQKPIGLLERILPPPLISTTSSSTPSAAAAPPSTPRKNSAATGSASTSPACDQPHQAPPLRSLRQRGTLRGRRPAAGPRRRACALHPGPARLPALGGLADPRRPALEGRQEGL